MPKRAAADPKAKGIYKQKLAYWLRYTFEGAQHRVNLHTRDFEEAIRKAEVLRGKPLEGKAEKVAWKAAIKRYLDDKLNGRRPAHLAGKRLRSFRLNTAPRVESCLSVFAATCGASSPSQVTLKQLQSYYDSRAKKSSAGAKSTIATIQAFLDHIRCLPGRVVIPPENKPEARQIVVDMETANTWISECDRSDLRFVLFCGFHAGMRAGEITHSRAAWFDLKRQVLTIPGKEAQTLPTGREYLWRSKDGETREIPLSETFCLFLHDFLADPKREFCIPAKRRARSRKATGLLDFRSPFEKFVAAKGRTDVTPHSMRHSWISELANSGNHSITEVAAWSGDTIQTIERNYWHKRVRRGNLNDTMAGKRSSDTIKEVAATLKEMSTTGLDKETAEAVKKLIKAGEKSDQLKWNWTKEAPLGHSRLYSVEDTINKFAVFRLLLEPEDADMDEKMSDEDWHNEWEEGKYSTRRARLDALWRAGLISET
jgi:integrase